MNNSLGIRTNSIGIEDTEPQEKPSAIIFRLADDYMRMAEYLEDIAFGYHKATIAIQPFITNKEASFLDRLHDKFTTEVKQYTAIAKEMTGLSRYDHTQLRKSMNASNVLGGAKTNLE